RNRQGLLDLVVVLPHLAPIERPVGAIAEYAARFEPFGPESQRHHRKMNGRSADALSRIVGAELQGSFAIDDALIGPIQLRLMHLVGCEVFERTPIGSRIE